MNLSILGPPGSGKGTVCAKLSKELGIVHISTGDMLREAVKNGTSLGEEANLYMSTGKLVPDEIIIGIVKERIAKEDCEKGFLLDGFPRTIPQAIKLDEMGPQLDHVISMEVSEEECVKRLTSRRSCTKCGRIYNTITNPPKEADKCDQCQIPLLLRDDDKPETVKERLKIYNKQTAPLIDYYKKTKRLLSVNASLSPEGVYKALLDLLK